MNTTHDDLMDKLEFLALQKADLRAALAQLLDLSKAQYAFARQEFSSEHCSIMIRLREIWECVEKLLR